MREERPLLRNKANFTQMRGNKVVLIEQGSALHHDPSAIRRFEPGAIRSSVVLPDPDGPTIAVRLPGATLQV